MHLRNSRGLTLVESLVSIALLGAFMTSFLGAFYISRLSTLRAEHRVIAMDIIRDYLEREIEAGFAGGTTEPVDYYETLESADPINNIPTESITVDNKVYTLTPDPYYPYNVYEDYAMSNPLLYENRHYKIVGFVVTWTEDILGSGIGPTLSERATVYLFDHDAE